MALAPRWSVTRRAVRSPLVLAPLALVYGLLLCWSWQPDTFSLVLPGSWGEGFKGARSRVVLGDEWGSGPPAQTCLLRVLPRMWVVNCSVACQLQRPVPLPGFSSSMRQRAPRCPHTRCRCAGGFNPQFMPSLPGICKLFSRWRTAASLWVHLLAANLFAARSMYLQGGRGAVQRGGRAEENWRRRVARATVAAAGTWDACGGLCTACTAADACCTPWWLPVQVK